MARSGYEKAAIFLRGIGEERAAEVLKSLDLKDISLISSHMNTLAITPADVEKVFREAQEKITSGELYGGSGEYIKRVLSKVLGEEKAARILDAMAQESPISSIKDIDTNTLSNFLFTEHPQTVALALCLLEPSQAAEVLARLPEAMRADVVVRMASTERIPANAVEELEESLKQLEAGKTRGTRVGGTKVVAEMLNQADRNTEQSILEKIEEEDGDLAESIRQHMFVFEDIVAVDDRGIQAVLKEVSTEDLVLALKTASEAMKGKIFKNMSQRAAQILKEEMEVKGPVRVSEVEKAQQNIVRIARKLADEGKVILAGKGGEEFV
ncbi:MAG: flagellar motor switch protein FliG [Thermodesulfovibrionales bacterium]